MRRAATAMLSLLLAACDRGGQPAVEAGPTSAGERIEQAARAQGVVPDPDVATLTGVWSRDTDRLCIVDAPGGAGSGSGHGGGSGASGQRIGIVTDFGDGQGCIASGAVRRSGDALAVSLGRCRFVARLEEGRIVFPGTLPDACALLCRGRASLTGLDVERQSESASEAVMLRSRGGRQPCA